MDLLAHITVTVVIAILLAAVYNHPRWRIKNQDRVSVAISSEIHQNLGRGFIISFWNGLGTLGKYADLRILVIGSLLPDIIDKPLGHFIFKNTFNNGRIFAHTLLFLIALTVAGGIIYKCFRKTWMMVLAFGTFTHLILDRVWASPKSLFWPLFGFTFPRGNATSWVGRMLTDLITNPATYITETTCLIVIVCFILILARSGQLHSLIFTGRIKSPVCRTDNYSK